MYPYQRTPLGNPYISPIYWEFMGFFIPKNPQREHQLNTMGFVHVREWGPHPSKRPLKEITNLQVII